MQQFAARFSSVSNELGVATELRIMRCFISADSRGTRLNWCAMVNIAAKTRRPSATCTETHTAWEVMYEQTHQPDHTSRVHVTLTFTAPASCCPDQTQVSQQFLVQLDRIREWWLRHDALLHERPPDICHRDNGRFLQGAE